MIKEKVQARVLVLGAGKIGRLIGFLLADSKDYYVYLADLAEPDDRIKQIMQETTLVEMVSLNAKNSDKLKSFIKQYQVDIIVSSLPYYCNASVIEIAKELNLHYFDLTEDTKTAAIAAEAARSKNSSGKVFIPQCGLAPGFISIVANDLMKHFTELESVKLRVGALPTNISNSLQYSITWSIDGLINEYGNLCQSIENYQEVKVLPLEGMEEIKIDGLTYEAFNTSGGVGTLVESYLGKVKNLSYKTIRYPGHGQKMSFLMNDLQLNHDRETLKRILENVLPRTFQDVVLVYVAVTGKQDGHFQEENYVKKLYPKKIKGMSWSAIQMTTASGLCAVLDLVMANPGRYRGLVRQEDFLLEDFIQNRFGQYYEQA
ncbi:MAG: saccharopine dehydrogenase NADP-binding domain-containing protein [Oligoflexia bacterium]|nr:saccharopine dehydrogenase NADP-binding domain-containing protein [Oligoflexia bacterium]MBF0364723.1 saccharopine dehydrogenase NADP-binding domain-containing protein [Oligoflexia bacterium]